MDIHESLNQVLNAKDRLGQMFYEHFLTRYPEVQHYFQGVDLKRQGILLTTALMIIERFIVQPTPAIEQYLQYLGSRHHSLQVPQDVYPTWIQAMLETLAQFHGADWSASLEQQWRAAFERATNLMFEGYKERMTI